MKRWMQCVLAGALSAGTLSACTFAPVQPWQREVLAREPMQLDAYPLDAFLDDHVYFSKEGALGGRGIGGGGCGCN
jgi:hypothetical protein